MLTGKKILIGVCGSIAAYKSAHLIRLFIKEGAEVRVVMTASASSFITPLTLSTLSKHQVYTDFENGSSGVWNNHVDLGLWADAFIIAPASANTLGKMANGLCDNFLTAVYLSARCPVFFAPAMDLDMHQHPAVVSAISKLKGFGNHLIEAESGELASGLYGTGRMAEPENILSQIHRFFSSGRLKNKKVLITAGPTREPLDPVRYITNHSSGKMGYALAKSFAAEGAEVTVVCGPIQEKPDTSNIKTVDVTTAVEMHKAVMDIFEKQDILIFAAAVADYTPAAPSDTKIKKNEDTFALHLKKNPDIAAEAGKKKRLGQFLAGFALETNNEKENALKKLKNKNLDMIILNSLKDEGAGFGHETNKISILEKDNNFTSFELKSKEEVAKDIKELVIKKIHV
ncbi:bifunctional phosphopantothenoylcysteine decarboxylase/phosphopantothenate--cysteine ligase CoaBC [Cytophagaceae bacterium ABcell3]|nr:bifunctional phosphopantothenoylcysteine decarboxylase/phosphopantothenate--cysteine ligase CoaBC [Cytophagaceae bacterium ABcell3]